jgi:hypothetical protein
LARNIGFIALVALLIVATGATAQSLIDGGDIKNNSVTGKDVRNKSLTKKDFAGVLTGPRGRRGAQGPQGAQGPPGPAGPINASGLQTVTGPEEVVLANDFGSSIAFCPAGQRVVSGGGFMNNGGFDGLQASEPNNARTSWFVISADNTGFGGTIQAVALCAGAGSAVAAKSTRAQTRRQVARLIAKLKAQRAAVGK